MKHPQVNASQSSRNAGLVAIGFACVLIIWHWVGYYALISCVIGGLGTYANDIYYDNSTSKLDPVMTLAGGFLACVLIYARHHL